MYSQVTDTFTAIQVEGLYILALSSKCPTTQQDKIRVWVSECKVSGWVGASALSPN